MKFGRAAATMRTDTSAPTCREALTKRQRNEAAVADEVAAEHPPRLLHEPVRPLESKALHPTGGTRGDAGHYVERSSDPHCKGHSEVVQVLGKEAFLAWCRHRDEQQVGT